MITDDSSLFDSLNQDILNLGFTTQTLSRLETLTRQVNDGTALSERIPQAQQSGLSKGSTVLTAAAIICRGCPPTESDVRQIYDTDDLVGDGRIQERLVELDISSISQLKQLCGKPIFYRLTAELFIINLAESRFFLTLRKVIDKYHEGNRQKIRDWANPEVV